MTVFEQVKSAIDMKTVAEGYGLHIDRGGMTLCPFHNEKTPSAKIYGDNFHCFGCGEHHDVIGFTQKLFQLNKPIDSVKKLNTDFGLNIDIETVPTKADISEYQERVNEQKAYAELDAVEKKQVKLIDIDSVETKKSVFGGKVTVSKEDYEALSDLAKKHVINTKQTKKLKSENAELRKENAELRKLAEKQNAELEKYRQPATFSRENLSKEAKRISREDELSRELRKAKTFIDAYGLSEDFKRFAYNKLRNTEIE